MRILSCTLSLLLSVLLSATGSCFAQDTLPITSAPDEMTTYIVQVTEYRLEKPIDPSVPAEKILAMLKTQGENANSVPVETIRLSTLSGMESMVQFGRRVSIATGSAVMTRGGQTVTNYHSVDVGSVVKVTASPHSGKVALKLLIESSRVADSSRPTDEHVDAPADVPADVANTNISTTLMLELGKPSLVGSTTTAASSVIVVTVTLD